MNRTLLLLFVVALSACGEDSSKRGAPDAGSAFCQAAAQQCSLLTDCALMTGDCSEAQQAVVLDCLTNLGGTCTPLTLSLCYDTAACVYGGTPAVCGDGTCGGGETSASCPADCPVPTCGHDECTVGAPLGSGCTACTTDVCGSDPYCCDVAWDSNCITQAQSVCGLCP